jgi:hypothetical protein
MTNEMKTIVVEKGCSLDATTHLMWQCPWCHALMMTQSQVCILCKTPKPHEPVIEIPFKWGDTTKVTKADVIEDVLKFCDVMLAKPYKRFF